jgi:CBS domain containing-hemolysin-like protein
MLAPAVEASLSVLLLLAASAASSLRTALLVLGEEGLVGSGGAGHFAAPLLSALRDPSSRHPFGLFALSSAARFLSALLAGVAAGSVASFPPWGAAAAASGCLAWLLLLFLLEGLAVRLLPGGAEPLLAFLGAAAPLLVRAGGRAGAFLESAGRLLLGRDWSPEGLMDMRVRSEEGILEVIEEGAEAGVIDATEERLMEGVLRFGETTVAGGMTHRAEVVFLREGAGLAEVLRTVGETGHARFPVLSPDGEAVTGILSARSLFRLPEGERWESLLEKPLFVPESMKVTDLLRHFQRAGGNVAVVIDEHGTLRGIITIHDLVERIVGRLSGGREPGEEPEWQGDGSLLAPGSTTVAVLREEYGIRVPEGIFYETAAGYVLNRLQAIPAAPVSFRMDGYVVTVTETERYRLRKIRFEKAPGEEVTSTP